MTLKRFISMFSIVALGFSLSACKGNFSSSNDSSGNGGLGCVESGTDCPNVTDPVPDVSGKITEGAFAGLEVIRVDVPNKTLVMSIPMPLPFGKSIKKPIEDSELEDAYWELKQYDTNKWIVEVVIPLKNLVNGKFSDVQNTAQLPTGDALPGLLSGEIPGFAVKWDDGEDKELFIYIGGGMVGVYVPTYNFDPFIRLDVEIQDPSKNLVGWFSTIPETEQYYGGFYISHLLPRDLANWVDNNLY